MTLALIQNLYQTTTKGGIASVGNTLGLWGLFNPPNPSITGLPADGIGCFTTDDVSLQFANYPRGTTSNWRLNSSSNTLSMPTGSTVLKAILFYSGIQKNGAQDVSSFINTSVSLTNAAGIVNSVTPTATSSITDSIFGRNVIYLAYTDVTQFVTSAGNYKLGAVPGCLGTNIDNDREENFLGWSIIVAYANLNSPNRNLNIYVAFDQVADNSIEFKLDNFITPPDGKLSGKLFLSVGSGDNYLQNDTVSFGPNANNLSFLSGTNNAIDNFFQSQINDDNGSLSSSGTFGTNNMAFAQTGTAPPTALARQGWDKTAVDISSTLDFGQISAVMRYTTSGDVYFPVYLGTQIDVAYAYLTMTMSVDKNYASSSEVLTYTLVCSNNDKVGLNNIRISSLIPANTTFQFGTAVINGVPNPLTDLSNGINIGSLAVGGTYTISYKAIVNSNVASYTTIREQANGNYTFVGSAGTDVDGSSVSNQVSTEIDNSKPDLSITKIMDPNVVYPNSTLNFLFYVVNRGISSTINTVLSDALPPNITFVPGSVTVNGIAQTGANPTSGINLGRIAPNNLLTVRFKATVTGNIPSKLSLSNTAIANFQYTTANGVLNRGSSQSNTVIYSVWPNPTLRGSKFID